MTDDPYYPAVWRKNIGHNRHALGGNEVSIYVDAEVTICSDVDDEYYSGTAVLTVDEVRRIVRALNAYLDTVKEGKE